MKKVRLTGLLRQLVGSSPPGSSLPGQRELCARFGATTFTLHQSLRQLEQEGLITVVPRKGIFVREPEPNDRRVLHVVYLDNPEVVRVREYGLSAFLSAVGRWQLECRTVHVPAGNTDQLEQAMAESRREPGSAGVIVAGCVDAVTAPVLRRFRHPWVMFGDGHTEELLSGLPSIACDNFQGAQLAAELLVERQCDAIVLVNFSGKPDWPWVREARAGALAAVEQCPAIPVLLPNAATPADPQTFETEAAAWIAEQAPRRLGVLCRCYYALPAATPLRHLLPAPGRIEIAVMDEDVSQRIVPGLHHIICPIEKKAEAALRRLAAMRRGADSPGRLRIPYQILQAAVPRAAGASDTIPLQPAPG